MCISERLVAGSVLAETVGRKEVRPYTRQGSARIFDQMDKTGFQIGKKKA
jgi:hypothetical protein